MKMSVFSFSLLKKYLGISKLNMDDIKEQYETGKFVRSDKVKDLQKRLCFDLYYYLINAYPDLYEMISKEKLNEDHIYTAMRKVTPVVVKRY